MLAKTISAETTVVTPEMATALLDHNNLNRPLSDAHVRRIAQQITKGKWRFNGDTIKISDDGQVLDGQHRLWAVIEANKPIDTILVRGVDRQAFTTIDTIRRSRSAADTIALMGVRRHGKIIGGALSWLIRWQRGIDKLNDGLTVIQNYHSSHNRVENSDIEAAFEAHPHIASAVDRAMKLRRVCNPSILAFLYYVTANADADLADRFVDTLQNPVSVNESHPFFQFRAFLLNVNAKKREPDHVIALAFKALNAVSSGRKIAALKWVNQGKMAEKFPRLEIGRRKPAPNDACCAAKVGGPEVHIIAAPPGKENR